MLSSVEVNSQSTAGPNKFALVIGITGYPNFPAGERLQYADHDAQLFSSFIQSEPGGAFPSEHVRLLINREATRPNISK